MREVVIYVLMDPRDKGVKYVGQTVDVSVRGSRHIHDTTRNKRCGRWLTAKERWILDLLSVGLTPHCVPIETVAGKDAADKAEVKWIEHYRTLGLLTNTAVGGGGPRGPVPSKETKRRISEAKTGRKATPAEMAHILKLAEARRAKKGTAECREMTKAANAASRGRKKTPEEIRKLRAAHKGRVFSPETISRMSQAQKNIPPEVRQFMGRGARKLRDMERM